MDLKEKRKEIDSIDDKLLELLNKRIEAAKDIGQKKADTDEPIYDPVREQEILEGVLSKNSGPLEKEDIELIFREIFSISRNAQKKTKVAYLGPEATFTHIATLKHFGSKVETLAFEKIREIFKAVEKGEADYGVIAIENSLVGSVSPNYDLFIESDLSIIAEFQEKIEHNLISKYRLRDIKKVYSHPVAIAQCSDWLNRNLPDCELIEVSSTAKSAESANLYNNSAGIASQMAADLYGLDVVAKNIQDNVNNTTRFLVIGKKPITKKPKNAKTSVLFTAKNEAGALFNALEALKKYNINMTKIESRPLKQKQWDYVFFVDMDGYLEDENMEKAIGEMKKNTGMLKILGSYPKSV